MALACVLLAAPGCTDAVGFGGRGTALVIVPEFGELAAFAENADRLQLILTRVISNTVVTDTTVAIDPVSGEATVIVQVVLQSGAEDYTVLLRAIRSSDGAVLFEGTQAITVAPGIGATPVNVPITYTGPTGARVAVSPRDTAIAPGASFTFRAVVYDTANAVVAVPVTFGLVSPADSLILGVQKHTGLATAGTGSTGTVRVVARSADGKTDTARVSVGAVPAGILAAPGFATLGVGGTVTVAANLVDANGAVISPATATWTSRAPGVATVDGASGLIAAVTAGTAVVVGTSGTFTDSLLVRVAATGSVPVSAIAGGRAFRRPRVGDTVVVAITADMTFASGEVLGSYNALLTWNASTLRYVDVQAGSFGAPTINDTQVQQGSFRFSAANAQGLSGAVVVARVRFVAQATGSAAPQLTITELSAAQTFTNLLSSVIVTNGSVTVRP